MKRYKSDDMPKRPIRMMVYGSPGEGKTTMAMTFPNPIVLSCNREGGDPTLRNYKGIEVLEITTADDIDEALKVVEKNEGKWDTVIVDTVTYIAEAVISVLVQNETRGRVQQIKSMEIKHWGLLKNYLTQSLCNRLHGTGMHVVYCAMSTLREVDGVMRVQPSIPGSAGTDLAGKCDLVGVLRRVKVSQGGAVHEVPRFFCQPSAEREGRSLFPDREIIPTFEELVKRLPWVEEHPIRK